MDKRATKPKFQQLLTHLAPKRAKQFKNHSKPDRAFGTKLKNGTPEYLKNELFVSWAFTW